MADQAQRYEIDVACAFIVNGHRLALRGRGSIDLRYRKWKMHPLSSSAICRQERLPLRMGKIISRVSHGIKKIR